ncbi:MAG: 23S rRNA pseudouridine(2604) synthase RluF [Anaerocolumna sp.]
MAKRTKKLIENRQIDDDIRINKYLSDAGVCSRREADKYISEGKITIDGDTAVMGSKVKEGQVVLLEGKPIKRDEALALIAFNKPRGIVCTTDKREKDNIIDFIQYNKRIYPIGRLDKESEGLILLTNDGDIVNKILRAGNSHEKEYVVTVNKVITAELLQGLAEGVPILDTVTRPCKIKALDKFTFQIILTQGLNRQIRRMCEYFDYKVLTLKRTRVMNINLGHMQIGGYRNVTEKEIAGLNELISDSVNTTETLWNSMEDASEDVTDKGKKEFHSKPSYNQHKTTYKKDGTKKDTQKKNTYKRDLYKKSTFKKEVPVNQEPGKNTLKKAVSGKDISKRDVQRTKVREKDALRNDKPRNDKSRNDKSRNGESRNGESRNDILRKDRPRKEYQRKEYKKTETRSADRPRRDAFKKDVFKKDAFRKDTYKKNRYEKDTPGKSGQEKNILREDKHGKDILRKETPKKDVFNKDMPKRDNSSKEIYQIEFKKKSNTKGSKLNKSYSKTDNKRDQLRGRENTNKNQGKNYKKSERSSLRGRK